MKRHCCFNVPGKGNHELLNSWFLYVMFKRGEEVEQNNKNIYSRAKYYNALNYIPSLGPLKTKKLVNYLGHPRHVFEASLKEIAEIEGVGKVLAEKIILEREKINVEKYWKELKNKGFSAVSWEEPSYPYLLLQTYDPPPLLYYSGKLSSLHNNCFAIVGSRKYTTYGKELAYKFAQTLSNYDLTIVSGMAKGIDTFAHKGVLQGGRVTAAVLGCGLDICYPPENKEIKEEIQSSGILLSEFPPGFKPLPQNFPRRNRIISGLSLGVMVIEAGEKSGALITADFALEQGREVFAVPSGVGSPYSRGCHKLIKEGAKLVENIEDVLEELSPQLIPQNTTVKGYEENNLLIGNSKDKYTFSQEEKELLEVLHYEPITLEEITHATGFTPAAVSALLLELELKGIIKQLPGNYYVRNNMEVC